MQLLFKNGDMFQGRNTPLQLLAVKYPIVIAHAMLLQVRGIVRLPLRIAVGYRVSHYTILGRLSSLLLQPPPCQPLILSSSASPL
jgi:hypothetical protein